MCNLFSHEINLTSVVSLVIKHHFVYWNLAYQQRKFVKFGKLLKNPSHYILKLTWGSGLLAPSEEAPLFTMSDNWTMVLTAFWAATANCSCDDAAPATRVFVSSTRACELYEKTGIHNTF